MNLVHWLECRRLIRKSSKPKTNLDYYDPPFETISERDRKQKQGSDVEAGGAGSGCRGPNCGRPRVAVSHTEHQDSKGRIWHRLKMTDGRGQEVGYIQLIDRGRALQINESFVREQDRGKGLGKELYKRALKLAKKSGKDGIESSRSSLVTESAARVWRALGADEVSGHFVLRVKK